MSQVIARRNIALWSAIGHLSSRVIIGIVFLSSAVLPVAAALGLSINERGELSLNGVPFLGVGVNYYDAFARTLTQAAPTNYDAGFRELAARKIPFARFSAGGYWPQDWGLYQTNRTEYFTRLDGVVKSAERHGIVWKRSYFMPGHLWLTKSNPKGIST